jgi:hypothetical protein
VSDLGLLPVAPASEGPIASIYLWGQERRDVNYVARLLCRQIDPQYRWVEAVHSVLLGQDTSSPESDTTSPPGKHLVPSGAVRPDLLWTFLVPSGPRRSAFSVNEFLRLPEQIQTAVGAILSRAPPRVLAIANVDLLEESDFAETGFYGQFIEWLNSHEITLVATATGEPLLERLDFEYFVAVPPRPAGDQRAALGVCQWGDCANCLIKQMSLDEVVTCASRQVEEFLRTRSAGSAH